MDKPFPAYDGTEPYFFVSYDHGDSEVVYPEMSWIRASGFNLWYDEGIHVGTVWRQALADALSRCAGFIFFSGPIARGLRFRLDSSRLVV